MILEIEYEIVEPNQAVTLIPTNVVTSVEVSNIELEARVGIPKQTGQHHLMLIQAALWPHN